MIVTSAESGSALKVACSVSLPPQSLTYDNAGRLLHEVVTKGQDQVARYTTSYDSNSRVVGRTQRIESSTDNGAWTYSYDDAGRLQAANGPNDTSYDYDYDGAGNRTRQSETKTVKGVPLTTTTTTSYDSAGRPTSSSDGTTYGHDAAGNLTRIDHGATGLSYDYEPWSRMTKATELGLGTESPLNID